MVSKKTISCTRNLQYNDTGATGSDHVLLASSFAVNSNDTVDMHTDPSVINTEIAQWKETRSGPLVRTVHQFHKVQHVESANSCPFLGIHGGVCCVSPLTNLLELIRLPSIVINSAGSGCRRTIRSYVSMVTLPLVRHRHTGS
jgi:hypothetical protein